MLARSAQGLYWMSRYLERAQHLCRLLRLQTESLVDRPLREIRFGWHRIYRGVGWEPPAGSLEAFDSEDYTLADSYTLADDLTFERLNPVSVWSCLALGRENGRQMRQCISAEMWTCLNRTYLHLRDLEIQNIWRTSPESFYAQTAEQTYNRLGSVSVEPDRVLDLLVTDPLLPGSLGRATDAAAAALAAVGPGPPVRARARPYVWPVT